MVDRLLPRIAVPKLQRVAATVLVGLAAACAATPPPAPAVQAGPPAGINGRYRGTARLIRSDNRYCPRSGPRVYELKDGAVTQAYQGDGRARVPITAAVQPNGDFDVSDGVGRLQGHVAGGNLTFTIASDACEHHWTMSQVD